MDVELNATYITLDGFMQLQKYRYLYFVIMFSIYILILCCNSTISFLIMFQKSLHEPMYIFIAALLLNSVLFSIIFYPKILFDLLSERQIISIPACFFQSFMFYTLSASEFLLLTVMAFDRYVSICKPLQYPVIMSKRTVSVLLSLAWIMPVFYISVFKMALMISNSKLCGFILKGIICKCPIYKLLCGRSVILDILPTIIFVNVAFFPVILILFSYTRLIMITYRSSKEVRRKAAQTCLPHLIILISFLCLVASDVTVNTLASGFSKTENFITSLQILIYPPLFNPIIYGLKMKEITKHLKRLLCRVKIKVLE
ncbi:olfactory receptor 10J4-like [Odontesthes bonariensis]|uniref:olfactory receptor 10J4-like n=1 Tax=Odontesthes bonariensis TaxID=219752 RepID=UPI003F5848AB